jgi:VWFA-related protein
MRRRFTTAGIVGLAGLVGLLDIACANPTAADEPDGRESPAPTFAATTDVIRVDAVVTDKRGRVVKGLTVKDFVVREDGEPQVLTSFTAVDLTSAPVARAPQPIPAAPRRSSGNEGVGDESSRRVLLIVIDDGGLSLAGAIDAQKAVKRFLFDVTRPGDLVSLVVAATGLTWFTELPEGRAQLASVVDTIKGRRIRSLEHASIWDVLMAARSGAPQVRLIAQSLLEVDRERRRQLFESVSAALDAVASVKGRKTVVLFSNGFIQEPDDRPFRDLVATMLRNYAALYFVDVKRLTTGIGWRRANPLDSAGAEVAAEETGGFTVRDLKAGLTRIAQESSSYYILGYSSTNQKTDGKYRRV